MGTIIDNGDGTWSWSHPVSDGPDLESVTVTADYSGGATDMASFDLTTDNAPPTLAADFADVTVDEGTQATNSGTFSDPGVDDITLSASLGTVIDNGDGTWSWSWDTLDGPEDSATVTITATDSDGAATDVMFDLTVDNVAPQISADEGSLAVLSGVTRHQHGQLLRSRSRHDSADRFAG